MPSLLNQLKPTSNGWEAGPQLSAVWPPTMGIDPPYTGPPPTPTTQPALLPGQANAGMDYWAVVKGFELTAPSASYITNAPRITQCATTRRPSPTMQASRHDRPKRLPAQLQRHSCRPRQRTKCRGPKRWDVGSESGEGLEEHLGLIVDGRHMPAIIEHPAGGIADDNEGAAERMEPEVRFPASGPRAALQGLLQSVTLACHEAITQPGGASVISEESAQS